MIPYHSLLGIPRVHRALHFGNLWMPGGLAASLLESPEIPTTPSIKQFVLEPTLTDVQSMSEEHALQELENLLMPRIEAAHRGDFSSRTPKRIFESVQSSLK